MENQYSLKNPSFLLARSLQHTRAAVLLIRVGIEAYG